VSDERTTQERTCSDGVRTYTNHLTGSGPVHELLMALTDEELDEYIDYWKCQEKLFRKEANPGMSVYWSMNLRGYGQQEKSRRTRDQKAAVFGPED
jgi:hypothetical protein